MKPDLRQVTGEILASMQPRPLAQHLGQQRAASPHMSHIKTINHTRQQNKTGASMSYLHTVLRLLDGVMQQTLESTLKRPALLHKRLVTADTHKVIHADITHDSDNRLSLYTGDVLYVCR